VSAYNDVQGVLSGDASLLAILTGGLYDGLEVREITRQATPNAFDAFGELLPCAITKPETATPWGPHPDSGRLYLLVWFYQQQNHVQIEAARERVYKLLHRQEIAGATGIYDVRHANDLLGVEAQGLDVPMIMSRYVVTVQR
jgi:hypothetical protein